MLFLNECEIALIDVILIKVQFDTFIYSKLWDGDQHESFDIFHCAHISKPVYYIYFSSFVNLLIL